MLTVILISVLTTLGFQQPDSIDHDWLVKEWNKSYEQVTFDMESTGTIYLVTVAGEVVYHFDKAQLPYLVDQKAQDFQKADFMFSLYNDDYYLMPIEKPKVRPAKTYQYSSAE